MALRGCLKICLPPVFQVYFAAMSGQNERKSYPTDLTDAEWQRIAPYLPERKSPRGRPRVHSYREILNAIFYVQRNGCVWRLLPHDLPPWRTAYHYFRLWRQDGTWARIQDVIRPELQMAPEPVPASEATRPDNPSVVTTAKEPPEP
jgi:putative transposase